MGYGVVYGLIATIPMYTWSYFIHRLTQQFIDLKTLCFIYARTQLAKYMPGNVFHFLTRHLDTSKLGVGHSHLINGSLFEVTGLLIASAVLSAIGFIFVDYPIEWLKYGLIGISLILTIGITGNLLRNRFMQNSDTSITIDRLIETLKIIPLYFLFFVATGLLFIFIYYFEVTPAASSNLAILFFTVIISWIAGFVTPGAPGGMGIREAAILLMLTPVIGELDAMYMALGYRVVTILGDVALFLISSVLEIRHRKI